MHRRLAVVVSALVSSAAFAQEHHGPPAEATAACAGLSANTACGFTFRGKNHTGTCEAPPDGSGLACRPGDLPKHDGRHGPHGPPPEAVTACASAAANAACSFTFRDGPTVKGTCTAPPDGTGLACKPEGDHRGPPRPPPEAFTACASASANQACTVTFGDRSHTGTCVSTPEGKLVCRPDHLPAPPPPPAAP